VKWTEKVLLHLQIDYNLPVMKACYHAPTALVLRGILREGGTRGYNFEGNLCTLSSITRYRCQVTSVDTGYHIMPLPVCR
jgi:hypothetical protein